MKNRKAYLVVVCLLLVVLSSVFLGERAQARGGWGTHEGIITKAYFQDIQTGLGLETKTIIVMKHKQLMFSGAYDGEIPLGVKVRIQVRHPNKIIRIEKIGE